MRLSKRQLLGRVAASLALIGLGRGLAAAPGPLPQDGRAAYLLDVLVRPDSAAIVGGRYLRDHPEEADADRLLAAIERRLARAVDGGAAIDPRMIGRHALRRALRTAVSEDFSDGRTVDVAGWILAETEVRLCALSAVRRGQAGAVGIV